jgi:signal transduction histidine kinase/ligand-binding sensor domain-containing protein/DNA-binding response OmpR family regulator
VSKIRQVYLAPILNAVMKYRKTYKQLLSILIINFKYIHIKNHVKRFIHLHMMKLKSTYFLFFILLNTFFSNFLLAQDQKLVFHRLTDNDGLSNGSVADIFQDSQGFIWLCTEDGLNLFDGYTFKTYKHSSTDSTSISNNTVLTIIEDKGGKIWVGTNNGLNVFDRSSQTFKKYFFNQNNSKSISSDRITKFCLDHNDQLWIGTDNGLNRFNPQTKDFTRYNVKEDLSRNVKGNTISDLACDKNGMIWTSEYFRGMFRIDPKTGSVKNFPVNPNGGLIKDIVLSICTNPNGNLWLGLLNGQLADFDPVREKANYFAFNINQANLTNSNSIQGIVQSDANLWFLLGKVLVKYDIRTKATRTYSNDPLNPESLPKGTPLTIKQIRNGNIWIGLEGIAFFNPKGEKFSTYYHILPKETPQIRQNYATTFYMNGRGNLLIGTFLDGLIQLNQETGQFKRLTSPAVFSGTVIHDIKEQGEGNLWIATDVGLVLYDPASNKVIRQYRHNDHDPQSLYYDAVSIVYPARNKKLLLSSQESLDILNLETNVFTHFTRENLQGLSHYKITAILEDRDGFIWIGTFKGLNKIDPKSYQITQYLPAANQKNQISDSYINTNGIYQDKSGKIWISTKNGLNRFDPQTNSFNTYYQSDGLLSDNVSQVKEDDSGNIWVTSGKGISKLNLSNKSCMNYTSLDGLDINTASFMKDKSGFFYIGGRHENYYRFHPDSIHDNLVAPDVYLTNFYLFNKPVGIFPADKTSPLQQCLSSTKELVLNYKQTDFAIEFTALNYSLAEKNRFAYKMEGFNEDWIYTDAKRRIAGYTNLDQGDYTFRVKASNNDGIWNEAGTSIRIKILPPPWKTKLAYSIYVIIIVISLYFIRSIMIRQLYLTNSLRLEHLELEKEREFDAIKTKFFTNISHEFRTPLTLISGPINKLIARAKENKTEENELRYLQLIEQNTKRLAQLTNQLLDFRMIETGTMKLELYHGDMVPFVQSICDRFTQFAQNKNISLEFSSSGRSVNVWFDPDKLDKITTNLLSNALKFTPENGKVSIHISQKHDHTNRVIIKVKDSGIGISPADLGHIFNRFYQVSSSNTSVFEGSGIGLALVKEMAKLCNGDITVESTLGEGSVFTIELPVELNQFENYTILSELKKADPEVEAVYNTKSETETQTVSNPRVLIQNKTKPTVLIIEDNKDMRFYISDILNQTCNTQEAENGALGLEKAFQINPDIIICDVMMPVMDGIEVTRILKTDSRTSHIPVLLLTALSSVENKLKGLETGANDYITKPFNPDILLLKIKNTISSRQKAKEYFIQSIEQKVNPKFHGQNIHPAEVTINSLDEKILQNALEIVEKNISDPEFNVDRFSAAIGMEASTLYKKLMALIDMPPGEFIRDIRMKRAAQLLDQNKISISEIAYMVGFDSPNYFSKVFKKYYNISPTDYLLQNKDKDSAS